MHSFPTYITFSVNSSGSIATRQPSRILYDNSGDGSTSPLSNLSNVTATEVEEVSTAVIIDASRGSIDNPIASQWHRQKALKF